MGSLVRNFAIVLLLCGQLAVALLPARQLCVPLAGGCESGHTHGPATGGCGTSCERSNSHRHGLGHDGVSSHGKHAGVHHHHQHQQSHRHAQTPTVHTCLVEVASGSDHEQSCDLMLQPVECCCHFHVPIPYDQPLPNRDRPLPESSGNAASVCFGHGVALATLAVARTPRCRGCSRFCAGLLEHERSLRATRLLI